MWNKTSTMFFDTRCEDKNSCSPYINWEKCFNCQFNATSIIDKIFWCNPVNVERLAGLQACLNECTSLYVSQNVTVRATSRSECTSSSLFCIQEIVNVVKHAGTNLESCEQKCIVQFFVCWHTNLRRLGNSSVQCFCIQTWE
jgi:hypothetical protein